MLKKGDRVVATEKIAGTPRTFEMCVGDVATVVSVLDVPIDLQRVELRRESDGARCVALVRKYRPILRKALKHA